MRTNSIFAIIKKPFLKVKGLKRWLKVRETIFNSDIILLNTITHSNLGDQAIVLAEMSFFKSIKPDINICELTGAEISRSGNRLIKAVNKNKNKVIYLHGGGYMGSIWAHEEIRLRQLLRAFSDHRIIMLPQTVTFDMNSEEGIKFFEESKVAYSSHKNLTVFVREQMSFEFMKENMPDVDTRLVPDIVLSYKPEIQAFERNGALLCMRSDIEKSLTDEDTSKMLDVVKAKYPENEIRFTDTVISHNVQIPERLCEVQKKLEEFAHARLIITDRLHGMVFALLSKTPCVAMGNINGKVKAVYQWFTDCPYIKYINSMSDLTSAIDELEKLSDTDMEYTFDINKFAPLKKELEKEFEKLI